MSTKCLLCGGDLNPYDLGTWKRVTGWVGGPRKDAMTMREDTGEFAHDSCVHKAKAGQAPDQDDIFSPVPEPAPDTSWLHESIKEAEEMLDG